jgi:hypothetical protein
LPPSLDPAVGFKLERRGERKARKMEQLESFRLLLEVDPLLGRRTLLEVHST